MVWIGVEEPRIYERAVTSVLDDIVNLRLGLDGRLAILENLGLCWNAIPWLHCGVIIPDVLV
jgi:hypothetical protein